MYTLSWIVDGQRKVKKCKTRYEVKDIVDKLGLTSFYLNGWWYLFI